MKGSRPPRRVTAPPTLQHVFCEPDGPPLVLSGAVQQADEKTYMLLPFDVRPGTARLDIDYGWEPRPPVPPPSRLTQTVLDLGLWDERGYRSADGFRGWSGDRHRQISVGAAGATRGYRAGPIGAGTWHVELGVGAVGPTGATWTVSIHAHTGDDAAPPIPERSGPVDPSHVANSAPGWYHGDFHMHGWHSHPEGPSPEEVVAHARAAGLDFLPVTEYVVGHHWDEYGAVQRAHPDLVIWPGREIVTYWGHVQSLGETPGFVEYRHGFEDIRLGDIQRSVRAAGALFGINHPTTFPGPLFRAYCRGCAFELGSDVDWDAVDTMEVLTGEALLDPRQLDFPSFGGPVPNPFFPLAVDLWEALLNRGHRITAVCGSDDKLGAKYGTCATAVYAAELSRPAIVDAVRAGRAYVRARGVKGSPALDLALDTGGTFGSVVHAGAAEMRVTVTGGAGQCLRLICNAAEVATVPVTSDVAEHTFPLRRATREGPLGTWYRIETFDRRGLTTLGNPVFLQ
jgi:hypothetical protein